MASPAIDDVSFDDVIFSDDGTDLTYFRKSNPRCAVRFTRDGVVEAVSVARDYHGGQGSALYRLSCGTMYLATLEGSATEMRRFLQKAEKVVTDDVYYEAERTASVLESAVSRIKGHLIHAYAEYA